MPGLTETSLLPQALKAGGHDLGAAYTALTRRRWRRTEGLRRPRGDSAPMPVTPD